MRAAALALFLLLAPSARATPFQVEFTGRVTSVGGNAPASFFVGEEVLGGFLYLDDHPAWITNSTRFETVDPSGGPVLDEPTNFPGSFPLDSSLTAISQLFQSGGVTIAVGDDFKANDTASEYLWIGSASSGSPVRFVGDDTGVFVLGSGGLLSTGLLGATPIDALSELQTMRGPVATGLQIDLVPGTPELRALENDLAGATFQSLSDPAQLRPTGGSILFDGDRFDLALGERGSVEFEITGFTIQPFGVPEPHSLLLAAALFGMALPAQRRSC